MARSQFKEGLLLLVPAVVVPLVVVLAVQGGPGRTGPVGTAADLAPGDMRPAEIPVGVKPVQAEKVAPVNPRQDGAQAVEAPPEPVPVAAPAEAVETGLTASTPTTPAPDADARPDFPHAQMTPAQTPLARGRQLARLFYTQRLDGVWAAFTPQVRAEWGGVEAFRAYRATGRRTYGGEARVLREELRQDGGLTYYLRTATFERGPRVPWTTIIGLDDGGRVRQFGIVEASLLPGTKTRAARAAEP